MRDRCIHRQVPGIWYLVFGMIGLSCLLAGNAIMAQSANPERLAATVEELSDQFEALRLSDGYLLRPLDETTYDSIELGFDGTVAIDGEILSRESLNERLPPEARRLLEWYLGTAKGGVEISEPVVEGLTEPEETEPKEDLEDPEPEEIPEETQRRSRTSQEGRDLTLFFQNAVIEEGERVRDAVLLFGSLDVEGEILGDAVVIGGSAQVAGFVRGDLTVVGGSVDLRSGGEVQGDIVSVGGTVEIDDEARTRGEIQEVGVGSVEVSPHPRDRWADWDFDAGFWPFSFGDVFSRLFGAFWLMVLVCLCVWFGQSYVESVAARAELEPWRAGLVGLLALVVFIPALVFVCAVLTITLIGIPIAVLLLIVGLLAGGLALLLGYSGVATGLGRFLERRFRLHSVGPILAVILGVALIQGWSILGEVLTFMPWPIKFSAFVLLIGGGIFKFVCLAVGVGAVILRQFVPEPGLVG